MNDVLYVALTLAVVALLTLLVGVLDRDRSTAPPPGPPGPAGSADGGADR